jgi:hypothetical protein
MAGGLPQLQVAASSNNQFITILSCGWKEPKIVFRFLIIAILCIAQPDDAEAEMSEGEKARRAKRWRGEKGMQMNECARRTF